MFKIIGAYIKPNIQAIKTPPYLPIFIIIEDTEESKRKHITLYDFLCLLQKKEVKGCNNYENIVEDYKKYNNTTTVTPALLVESLTRTHIIKTNKEIMHETWFLEHVEFFRLFESLNLDYKNTVGNYLLRYMMSYSKEIPKGCLDKFSDFGNHTMSLFELYVNISTETLTGFPICEFVLAEFIQDFKTGDKNINKNVYYISLPTFFEVYLDNKDNSEDIHIWRKIFNECIEKEPQQFDLEERTVQNGENSEV